MNEINSHMENVTYETNVAKKIIDNKAFIISFPVEYCPYIFGEFYIPFMVYNINNDGSWDLKNIYRIDSKDPKYYIEDNILSEYHKTIFLEMINEKWISLWTLLTEWGPYWKDEDPKTYDFIINNKLNQSIPDYSLLPVKD